MGVTTFNAYELARNGWKVERLAEGQINGQDRVFNEGRDYTSNVVCKQLPVVKKVMARVLHFFGLINISAPAKLSLMTIDDFKGKTETWTERFHGKQIRIAHVDDFNNPPKKASSSIGKAFWGVVAAVVALVSMQKIFRPTSSVDKQAATCGVGVAASAGDLSNPADVKKAQTFINSGFAVIKKNPQEPGIFRLAADGQAANELIALYKSHPETCLGRIENEGAILVAELLKKIVRPLRLIPEKDQWRLFNLSSSPADKLASLTATITGLPNAHRDLVIELWTHLHAMGKDSVVTKMTYKNLAICWAPNLLPIPTSVTNPQAAALFAGKANELVELLISHAPPERFLP